MQHLSPPHLPPLPHHPRLPDHQTTIDVVLADTLPTPSSVYQWVPGGEGSSFMCSRALATLTDPTSPHYRPEFAPWFRAFGESNAVHLASQAPYQAGLGGGCAMLAYPEMAYSWHRQMAPLLMEQLRRYHAREPPLPMGRFAGHPSVAVCELRDNTFARCTALTVPLYERLPPAHHQDHQENQSHPGSSHPTHASIPPFRYPTDVSVVGPAFSAPSRNHMECVAYDMPTVGSGR